MARRAFHWFDWKRITVACQIIFVITSLTTAGIVINIASDTNKTVRIVENVTSPESEAENNVRIQLLVCDGQRTGQKVVTELGGRPDAILTGECTMFFREHPDL